jgi:hypothetical protein
VALLLQKDTSICMCLGPAHNLFSWSTEKDGKVHAYTLHLAIKIDKLPSQSIPLFHGRGLAAGHVGSKSSPSADSATAASGDKGEGGARSEGGRTGSDLLECVQIYKNGGVGERRCDMIDVQECQGGAFIGAVHACARARTHAHVHTLTQTWMHAYSIMV